MQKKIQASNYTQIPNVIFDYWMAILSPGEFKVICAICRKTFGWNKQRDKISLRQLAKLTGLSERGVQKISDCLIEHGLITKIKHKDEFDGSNAPNEYELNVEDSDERGGVNEDVGGTELSSGGVRNSVPPPTTKETTTKEREKEAPPTFLSLGEHVKLTEKELHELYGMYGQDKVDDMIETMNMKIKFKEISL